MMRVTSLKRKAQLFGKIQVITFVLGIAFIVRSHTEHGVPLDVVIDSTKESLFGPDGWFYRLCLYGTCLFFIRTDKKPRHLKQVFIKWSLLFLVMEFITEWTKYGWNQASLDFPVMLLRYAAGGALAAAVWWLIECSPRSHPNDHSSHHHHHGHGHGHDSSHHVHHRSATTEKPATKTTYD
jgi:hypothetical protein